ncbi:enoyl-CoA hydratase/isomerase family protein [Gordonia sp. KTR9]|uniref:enoyl-CoA hydratase/isomerase family protein n=1 Tax=Gordonia sp. KTR9 TaxID=337191 RepID=UPI00027DDF55|nr:enoyl-CoA hydratase/isomerase family protein [Gordonia sp. KTR9]AFR49501.1 Enoyl-CoA hydratase / carnithine racemase [Gordonia sp. KTR9]
MTVGVVLTVESGAAVVTLDWPEKRNALNPTDADEIVTAIDEAGRSDAALVIVTGNGAFCSGGDLPAFAEISATHTPEQVRDTVYSRMQRIIRAFQQCPLPTAAAVDGAAIGLGLDIALAADMRFVGPRGWFRQGWANAGLIHGVGGIGLLRRLDGSLLWRLLADQERIDADLAERLGLGEKAEPTAIDAARERAVKLATHPRHLLESYARLAREDWPSDSHFDASADIQGQLIASAEFRALTAQVLGK